MPKTPSLSNETDDFTQTSTCNGAFDIPLRPISNIKSSDQARKSNHKYRPIPTVTGDPRNPVPAPGDRNIDWAGSWIWEVLGVLFSAICIVLLAVLLQYVNGRQYDNWKYRLSPNTIASVIVTIAKACLLVSVSSCLSQIKWTYGKSAEEIHLYDIQALDQASCGPMGSLEVLWRWRMKPGLATAGAFLTVLAMAVDPLAQQLLTYPNVRMTASNGTPKHTFIL
ncbi:hypothetical protein N7488_009230 [Penicillium malachiteum]|nr:hypothetical protein N7488_009230 [Penicillium malachiteum]